MSDTPQEVSASNPDRILDMLSMISGFGGASVATALLESFVLDPLLENFPGWEGLSIEDRNYLCAPVVVGKAGSWEEDLPSWLPGQVRRERIDLVLGKLPGHIVTPSEIICALYARTMVAPMGRSEWADLYAWAMCHTMARHTGVSYEQMQGQMNAAHAGHGPMNVPAEHALTGNDARSHFHREFARDLRRRIEKHGETARRAADKAMRAKPKVVPLIPPESPDGAKAA